MRCIFVLFLALTLLLPAVATAQPYITVRVTGLEPDGINVGFGAFLFQTPCLSVPDACERTELVTVTVTPCPPGVACDGGSYQFTWDSAIVSAPPLTLAPSTAYTFEASYDITVMALDNASKCRVLACEGSGPMGGTSLTTPDMVTPKWTATEIGEQDGLVMVEFAATVNELGFCSETEECYTAWYYLDVSPCPPGQTCPLGSYSFQGIDGTNDQQPIEPFQILLEPDVNYQIGGGRSVEVWGIHHVVACQDISCSYGEQFQPIEFLSGAVPADPLSWGALKVRY